MLRLCYMGAHSGAASTDVPASAALVAGMVPASARQEGAQRVWVCICVRNYLLKFSVFRGCSINHEKNGWRGGVLAGNSTRGFHIAPRALSSFEIH